MILDKKAYEFGKKIITLESLVCEPHSHFSHNHNHNHENSKTKVEKEININEIKIDESKDKKRIIGTTDYKKFENLAKGIEEKEEEIKIEKEKENQNEYRHLMGCNNDLRKERQLMDKPAKEKIEAGKRFKTEGDDLLKQQKFDEAINIYEKGLLQLFYTFCDDKEEDEMVDKIKEGMNLNCSFCKIKQEKYEEATQYLNEAMRVNKENLKTLYRMAFCHFKLEKFKDAKNDINNALNLIDKKGGDKKPFEQLLKDINNKIKDLDNEQDNLLKKMVKNKK
jgi:tetratricopeptide (TPR) repeat protein